MKLQIKESSLNLSQFDNLTVHAVSILLEWK